jgi:hypothetical protein
MLDILLFPVPAVNAIGVGTDGRRKRRHNLAH